ncbi:hypothetical protein SAY86_016718 [Trapa natans]|uniref:Ataxin 2 SM domain-containing protein n=1 Tax=Trapa natans TaxID=22666 RepID=A0AAN7LKN4_TRANT|nr:hypothetical protein SAY86_016718 [Trapa natans]
MGCRRREELPYEEASLSDALLFATMCIVGLPVDVHAKDGSIYSGIFHTASVEGVVLKKAKMTKKGKSNSNVAVGCVVETLVVLSTDLVQVVAKGVLLPTDGVKGNIAADELESPIGTTSSGNVDSAKNKSYASTMSKRRTYQKRASVQVVNGCTHGGTDISDLSLPRANGNEGKWVMKLDMRSTDEEENFGKKVHAIDNKGKDDSLPSSNIRQIEDDKQVELDNDRRLSEIKTAEVHNSSSRGELMNPSVDEIIYQGKPDEGNHGKLMPSENLNGISSYSAPASVISEDLPTTTDIISSNAFYSSMPTSPSVQADLTSQFDRSSHLQGSHISKKTKEFKLNPGAKVFSPTFSNSRAVTPSLVQTVAGVTYIPNASPMLPAQTDVAIGPLMPHSTVPVKVLQYNGIGDFNAQLEPVPRTPLFRYPGQHQNVPLGSTFVHPTSQPVMVGRLGQIMYVPLPQDIIPNAAAISPAFTRPLSTINQVPLPKQLGNFPGQQLMHLPSLAGVQHLYPAPNPVMLMQPPLLASPLFLLDSAPHPQFFRK